MRAVTYGPFPAGWPKSFDPDFSQIVAAGFNAIRLYSLPDTRMLDAASAHNLKVFGGLAWSQNTDFCSCPGIYSAATIALVNGLTANSEHPALAGIYVGNEVPADLVRWMGPLKVQQALEALIHLGKSLAPKLLFAYANYPSTEYLEPENADFTAFNVYLEDEAAFRSYLKRLQHLAGDRPLVISEFGLDSRRNGLQQQATVLSWACQAALELETAGMTIYAWSDRWWNAGAEVLDWDFGLLDRSGLAKPALLADFAPPATPELLDFCSIIICTRNGRERIGTCLTAIRQLKGGNFETLVVDDGSTDGSADFVSRNFPEVRLLQLAAGGLSTARNAGAAAAHGELLAFTDDDCAPDQDWLARLRPRFRDGQFAAAGGPNLAPAPQTWQQAVVTAAPGAPSHVMLDDDEAEHLPGCNLVVTRAAFVAIGGFDPQFQTAGDDVDFCWRLRAAGFRLGFVPGAFVWHWRRPSLVKFFRQQLGYGRAEHLLLAKYPSRFSKRGGAKWHGFIYGGGPVRVMANSIIYHGSMGNASYQSILNRMLPLRGLPANFKTLKSCLALQLVEFLQPRIRAWARNRGIVWPFPALPAPPLGPGEELTIESANGRERDDFLQILLAHGWRAASETAAWDLEQANSRVLIATERGDGGATRTRIRLWGPQAAEITQLLNSQLKLSR